MTISRTPVPAILNHTNLTGLAGGAREGQNIAHLGHINAPTVPYFEIWTLIIEKSTVIPPSLMVLLILIQLLKSSWSWHLEPWLQTIKGPWSRNRVFVYPDMCKNNPPPCFAQNDEWRIPKKSKSYYFFHGSCLTKELWATRPDPVVNPKSHTFLVFVWET